MTLLHHHCITVTAIDCSYNALKNRSTLEWCRYHTRAACWGVDVRVSVHMHNSHPLPSTHSVQVKVALNASALSQGVYLRGFFLLMQFFFPSRSSCLSLFWVAVAAGREGDRDISSVISPCRFQLVAGRPPIYDHVLLCQSRLGQCAVLLTSLKGVNTFLLRPAYHAAMLTEDCYASCMHSDKIWCVCLGCIRTFTHLSGSVTTTSRLGSVLWNPVVIVCAVPVYAVHPGPGQTLLPCRINLLRPVHSSRERQA
jgi:hypothetical protein